MAHVVICREPLLAARIVLASAFAVGSGTCLGLALEAVRNEQQVLRFTCLMLPLLALGVWFAYLARRGWCVGYELNDSAIRIRRVANDHVIPLNWIESICIEEYDDGESGTIRYHTARDSSVQFLFRIPSGEPGIDDFVQIMKTSCDRSGPLPDAEPGANTDRAG